MNEAKEGRGRAASEAEREREREKDRLQPRMRKSVPTLPAPPAVASAPFASLQSPFLCLPSSPLLPSPRQSSPAARLVLRSLMRFALQRATATTTTATAARLTLQPPPPPLTSEFGTVC